MELAALRRSTLVLLLCVAMPMHPMQTTAQGPTAAPAPSPSLTPAPAPAPSYVNITQVLVYAGDFSTFVSLLQESGVGEKLQRQANETEVGITIFAPTNKAFTAEPAATLLKSLSAQQVMSLLEYHALNNWESLSVLQQADDNATATFATYNGGGRYMLNVTNVQGQVVIVTYWNKAFISNTLYNAKPVSIFALGQVLLPEDLFGLPAPAPAPSPSSGAPSLAPSSASSSSGSSAAGPSSSDRSFATPSSAPAPIFSVLLLACLFAKLL